MFPQLKRAYSNSSSGKPPQEPEEGGLLEDLAAKYVAPWLKGQLKSEYEALVQKPHPRDVRSVLALSKIGEKVTELNVSISSGNLTAIKKAWDFRKSLQSKGLEAVYIG